MQGVWKAAVPIFQTVRANGLAALGFVRLRPHDLGLQAKAACHVRMVATLVHLMGSHGERHAAMIVCLFVGFGGFRGPLHVAGGAHAMHEEAGLSVIG